MHVHFMSADDAMHILSCNIFRNLIYCSIIYRCFICLNKISLLLGKTIKKKEEKTQWSTVKTIISSGIKKRKLSSGPQIKFAVWVRNRYSKAYIYSTEFNNLVPFISLLLYLESIGFCTIYLFNYINTILLSLHAKWSKYLLGWKTYISFVYIVRLWDSLTENDTNLYHSQIKMN